MITFKGRSTLKQYLPKKPIKRGFKMWDACKGVYFCDFEVYVGKAEDSITVQHTLGERVVVRLTESIRGLNHKLF